MYTTPIDALKAGDAAAMEAALSKAIDDEFDNYVDSAVDNLDGCGPESAWYRGAPVGGYDALRAYVHAEVAKVKDDAYLVGYWTMRTGSDTCQSMEAARDDDREEPSHGFETAVEHSMLHITGAATLAGLQYLESHTLSPAELDHLEWPDEYPDPKMCESEPAEAHTWVRNGEGALEFDVVCSACGKRGRSTVKMED